MYKVKRLLTDKELDHYTKLDDSKKQKKFLDSLQKQLWEIPQEKKK